MSEYAAGGLEDLFEQIHRAIPAAINSGIVGDQAHDYGYHRGRGHVPPTDYSVQLADDQAGHPDACCGLDLSWTDPAWQYTVSQRLLDAAGDPRMRPVREFYGSVDGRSVIGWDYPGGYPVTSDPTHTWHVHLSVLRKYADADLTEVGDVITGAASSASPPTEDEDEDDMKAILLRDGSGQFWCIRGDLSSKTLISEGTNTGLSKSGRYDSNPGIDQTTLARIPIAAQQ